MSGAERADGERAAEGARAPVARPLVLFAAAYVCGSWCASAAVLDASTIRCGGALLVCALLAACFFRIGGPCARARLERGLLVGLVASAAALRALPREAALPGEARDAPASLAEPTLAMGTWESGSVLGADERGKLADQPRVYELAPGSVEDGEQLVLLADDAPVRYALGPVAGPNAARALEAGARAGLRNGPYPLLPDQVVRVALPRATWTHACTAWLRDVRNALLVRIGALDDPLTRGLTGALLFGDMSRLPTGTSDLFVRTGTFHVLAISGMQVGLVAVLMLWPASALFAWLVARLSARRLRPPAELFRVALMLCFVPLAGAGPPVMRSALAYALGSCAARIPVRTAFARGAPLQRALSMTRKADSLSLWSLALACECWMHPDAPLSLSVQLSYAATLGLILGTHPIDVELRRILARVVSIEPVSSTGRSRSVLVGGLVRVLVQRVRDGVSCAIAASLAAVLATLPFVWTRFGEWSPVGILATPAIVVPMAGLLAASWLWLCVPALVPELVLDACAHTMNTLIEGFDRLPASPDPLPPRNFVLLATATIATFAWLATRARSATAAESVHGTRSRADERGTHRRADDRKAHPRNDERATHPRDAEHGERPRDDEHGERARAAEHGERPRDDEGRLRASLRTLLRAHALRCAALCWAIALLPWSLAPTKLELWALDVGNGTAVVLRAPGLGCWLFDAGSRDRQDVAREAVAPLLRSIEVGTLGIVLSHPDRDHDGALPYLVDRFPPRVWAGALPAHCAERLPHTTLRLDLGTGRVLLPALDGGNEACELFLERGLDVSGNEGSRFLCLRTGDDELVLCGDAEGAGLSAWLRARTRPRPLRLLLWPHHGSETELAGPLLRATEPTEVWFSSSQRPAIATELDRLGRRWRWTARDGPLALELDLARSPDDGPRASERSGP